MTFETLTPPPLHLLHVDDSWRKKKNELRIAHRLVHSLLVFTPILIELIVARNNSVACAVSMRITFWEGFSQKAVQRDHQPSSLTRAIAAAASRALVGSVMVAVEALALAWGGEAVAPKASAWPGQPRGEGECG